MANVDPFLKILSLLDSTINLQQHPCYKVIFPTAPHAYHYTTLRNFCCGHNLTLNKLLMVCVGVSRKKNLISLFVNVGSKTNRRAAIVPVMREICGEFLVFQQDSVPAHRACETISLAMVETMQRSLHQTPNSLELSPVDLRYQAKCSSGCTRKKVHDLDELKQCLIHSCSGQYAWEKYACFNVFYNRYKRTEQLWFDQCDTAWDKVSSMTH